MLHSLEEAMYQRKVGKGRKKMSRESPKVLEALFGGEIGKYKPTEPKRDVESSHMLLQIGFKFHCHLSFVLIPTYH